MNKFSNPQCGKPYSSSTGRCVGKVYLPAVRSERESWMPELAGIGSRDRGF